MKMLRHLPPVITLTGLIGLAGCAAGPAIAPLAAPVQSSLMARTVDLPQLMGARPSLLPGQRAIAQRTNPATPKTPYELWETHQAGRWQTAVRLFADLPSAYEPQLMAVGAATHLYFSAIPPRSYIPRVYQTRAVGRGEWAEPEKLDLLEQGRGAETPAVVKAVNGKWWMAYCSAGATPDVRLATGTDGVAWQATDKVADGRHPAIIALADGRLVLAYEQGTSVIIRQSVDGTAWQDGVTIPNSKEPALAISGKAVLLATVDAGTRRNAGVTWRRSADGRQWSSPYAVGGTAGFGSVRWLVEGAKTSLYGAAAGGQGMINFVSVVP
ncbi:MAG: hypothetical protein H7338_11485 [Candidatus Sericytochromatia bacterium]|nr:hypothetical protein [Candidatus Sericytochromatia bacterium]